MSLNKPIHSPLPWRVEKQPHRGTVVIVASDGYHVAMQCVHIGNATALGDAELIVAAVNATMAASARHKPASAPPVVSTEDTAQRSHEATLAELCAYLGLPPGEPLPFA